MILNNEHISYEVKQKTGSIYTPLDIVEKMMSKVEDEFWSDTTKTFCDPTCGVGNIIIPMLDNRVKHGIDPTTALKTMYGNELLKSSYDILLENLEEWANAHNVTDKSWKENFYNEDFFVFIQRIRTDIIDDFLDNKIRIECFIMNPPYTDGGKMYEICTSNFCGKIMKHLENQRVVCISCMNGTISLKHKLTSFEAMGSKIFYPLATVYTYIWTMNDNKPLLYNEIHKLKTVRKSNYFILRTTSTKYPKIYNKNKSEINRRAYLDIQSDEEMNEINEYLKENYTYYKDWFEALTTPTWAIANILYNSKWKERLVKE